MATTLIKNVFLTDTERDLLIKDGVISQIAPEINTSADKIINAKGKAILPSFCNTHTHAAMMFLRGIGEDKELFAWLNEDIWPREAKLTPEAIYHLSRFAILEMIKTGTTLFSDMYFHSDETVKAAEEMGIRGAISFLMMDFFQEKKTISAQEQALAFLQQKSSNPLTIRGLSCHSIYTTSEEAFHFAKELSQEYQTFLHIHAAETQKEVDDCINTFKTTPVSLLNQWGILDKNTILAHCLHLDDEEIGLMASTQAVVSHCPSSSLKLNSGQMPLQKYLDNGIRITLGTDGVSSNNFLSMPSEMKIAALSAKNISQNITAARCDDIFAIATVNGFNAFSLKAGKIKEGYLADFILVDLDNYLLLPNINIVSNMIYAADTSCVTDVFCNGARIMTDRNIKNEKEIISCFKEVCKSLS